MARDSNRFDFKGLKKSVSMLGVGVWLVVSDGAIPLWQGVKIISPDNQKVITIYAILA